MSSTAPIIKRRGRPPKIKNGEAGTRELLIRHGTAVLTEKGFASTGIGEILKQTGIPKGSFYHYFPSKDAYGLAVVENYGTFFARKIDRWLQDKSRSPLTRLQDFIDDAKDGMCRYDFKRGCLIGNLGQELGSLSETFRKPLEDIFLDWQRRVQICLDEAKDTGAIASTINTKDSAALFWISWEGAILRAKLVRSTDPIDLFTASFFTGLGTSHNSLKSINKEHQQ